MPAAHIVLLKFSMLEKLGPENPDQNKRYGLKIPTFWALEEDFLHSYARKVKTGKSSGLVENNRKNYRPVTIIDTAGKFRPVKTDTTGT